MPLRPLSSLTRRTLLLIGAAVSGLIVVTTFVTYRLIFTAVEERGRIHLDQYAVERAKREEARFVEVRHNLQLAAEHFRLLYHTARYTEAELDHWWQQVAVRDADGAWRSPRDRVDGTSDCTIWVHRDAALTPELLRRTRVMYDLLEMFRPVWIGSFRSLWAATPEMTNIGFDPLIADWVYNLPADWAQNDIAYFVNTGPAKNPERKITWTYQNVQVGDFYTVCLPIYEDDRLLVTLGHDIHNLRLYEESLHSEIAGLTHMIFAQTGQLVAHPTQREQIVASVGEYRMQDHPLLRSLYTRVTRDGGDVVSGFDPHTDLYFTAVRLDGPDWYYLTTLPRTLLTQQALHHAQRVLWVAFASLALILIALALILHRTVTLPLRRLIVATERLRSGDPSERLPVEGQDEIGRLSASFNHMASEVAERDSQLRQLNQNLERRIADRTAELAESESRVRTILENAPEAIVVIDVETGRFVDANENALQFLGVQRAELPHRSPLDARARFQEDGETSATVARARMAAAMEGEKQVFEWLYRPESGPDVQCEVRLSRLPSHQANLVIGTITDISEQKKTEQSLLQALARERELNQMKSGFVSIVSHEFRTPLGVILSSTEILEHYFDRLAADKRNEHLRTIVRAVRSLSRLVEEVLLLGQAEAGRLQYAPEPLNLATACGQFVDETRSATHHSNPIILEISPDAAVGLGDENLLRHILTNLLSNAAKYSAPGAPIDLSVRRSGNDAVFTIVDRGIGISPEDQRNLFKAFTRGRNVGQRPGTGLGLVIVRRFVRLHGGEIDLVSQLGAGTRVTVRLPMFSTDLPPAPAADSLSLPASTPPPDFAV